MRLWRVFNHAGFEHNTAILYSVCQIMIKDHMVDADELVNIGFKGNIQMQPSLFDDTENLQK